MREVWTCIREDFVPAAGFLEPEGFKAVPLLGRAPRPEHLRSGALRGPRPRGFPRWHGDVTRPDTVLDATVVAVTADGRYIGIASLVGDPVAKHLGCSFTGVARPYRNRGIATALQARTAQTARGMDCRELNAGGGGVDTRHCA